MSEDPFNILNSASSEVCVQLQGQDEWHGKIGFVRGYNTHRERYTVEVCSNQDIFFPSFVTVGVRPQSLNMTPSPSQVILARLFRFVAKRRIIPIFLLAAALAYAYYSHYYSPFGISKHRQWIAKGRSLAMVMVGELWASMQSNLFNLLEVVPVLDTTTYENITGFWISFV